MNSKVQSQLQTLLDNRDSIFQEYEANSSNMAFEVMSINNKIRICNDKKNIFSESTALLPTLNGLLDNTLDIMCVAFSEYGSNTHAGVYQLDWDVNYPVSRFYIANSGNLTVGKTKDDGNNYLKFVDWETEEDVNFGETASNNIYLSIDIWDPDRTAPTDQQVINYFKYYEHYPFLEIMSLELMTFIDAN